MRGLAAWILGFGPAANGSIMLAAPPTKENSDDQVVSAVVDRQVRAHVEL
jgi:hypothetical protein